MEERIEKRRRVMLVGGAVILGLALVWGFWPSAITVELAEVRRDTLRETVTEEGTTRVIDRFVVSAPVSGFVRRITLSVGDRVKKGQKLAVIDPRRSGALDARSRASATARVAAAEASLKGAKENAVAVEADSRLAGTELERVRKLFLEGFVPKGELETGTAAELRARAALRSAESSVEVARYALEEARAALKFFDGDDGGTESSGASLTIRSPIDGSVLGVLHKSEGAVAEGTPLLSLGNPHALEVAVDVLSADSIRARPGTPVIFERWGGARPLSGSVRIVEPAGFTKVSALGVEEQRVLVIVDITSPPEMWQRLGDGYSVEAVFILWEGSDVLQVPSSALFRSEGGWAAFIVEGDSARLRPVVTGRRGGLSVEVRSGLKEGDVVITHPDDTITDNSRVIAR